MAKSNEVNIVFSSVTYDFLKQFAKSNNVSISYYIRSIIDEFLNDFNTEVLKKNGW